MARIWYKCYKGIIILIIIIMIRKNQDLPIWKRVIWVLVILQQQKIYYHYQIKNNSIPHNNNTLIHFPVTFQTLKKRQELVVWVR